MPEPLLYLQAMGTAAVVSTLCVLTMARMRQGMGAAWLNLACVAGMGLGLVLGYHLLSLPAVWPPRNGLDRFLTIILPVVLGIELIAGFKRLPDWGVWFLRASLAAAAPRILLHGSVYLGDTANAWTMWQSVAVLAACTGLLAGVWLVLSRLSRRAPGVSMPLALALTIQCAGLTVMMAGYLKGGAAAFPLAATLASTSIVARWRPRGPVAAPSCDPSAIVPVGVVGLFGLLFIGRFFGRLSTGSALAMLLAPLLCWATEIPLLRDRTPWVVGTLRLTLVFMLLVAVLVAAKRDFDRDMRPLLGNTHPASGALGAAATHDLDAPFDFSSLSFNQLITASASTGAR